MKLQTRPNGVYNTLTAWQCRQCSFQSEPVSNKSSARIPFKGNDDAFDNKVYAAAGVMYRWVFLAKSHVKCKSASSNGEYNYGCLFCCAAGRASSVHGNVDMLMGHIVSEHVEDMMRPDVQQRTNCVFGRLASTHEDFDVCIPAARYGGNRRAQHLPFRD